VLWLIFISPGATYYYKVYTVGGSNDSEASEQVSATPGSAPAPGVPTRLTASPSDGEVTLRWDAAQDAEFYNIYFGSSPGVYSPTSEDVFRAEQTSFVHEDLTNGKTYYYVVTAGSFAGEGNPSNEASATPTSTDIPDPPANVLTFSGDGEATISWDGVLDADTYNLYVAEEPGVTKNAWAALQGGRVIPNVQPPYTHSGLSNGVTYYFAVTSVNAEGVESETASAEASAKPSAEEPMDTVVDKSDLNMTFVRIPGGSFTMGSQMDDEVAYSQEKPSFKARLTHDFYLMTTEVTQAQWETVMGSNPSDNSKCGGQCPVENVTWDDVQLFIEKLNEMEGKNYRLPTEAEWEYAARAGQQTDFANGDITETECGIDPNLDTMGWYCGNATVLGGRPVGQKEPNDFGLYDMHGNVWEWCQDWLGAYTAEAKVDPVGSDGETDRAIRGGAVYRLARDCRSAMRQPASKDMKNFALGFRLAMSGPKAQSPATAPPTPDNVAATPGEGTVTLSWDPVAEADSYKIYWGFSENVSAAENEGVLNATEPGFTHEGLENGNTYFYTVLAVNAAGDGSPAGVVSAKLEGPVGPIPEDGLFYVDGGVTASGDGHSWETAFKSVNEVIAHIASPDVVLKSNPRIWVKEGEYLLEKSIEFNADEYRSNSVMPRAYFDISLYGGFNGTETNIDQRDWKNHPTIIDGQNSVRCIYTGGIQLDSIVIDGFTFRNGHGYDANASHAVANCGGAIFTWAKVCAIQNCLFINNEADFGGAIFNTTKLPELSVINCMFSGNKAVVSGGAVCSAMSVARLENCLFSENSAQYGGAIQNSANGTMEIVNSTFYGNSADWGVAVRVLENAATTIVNSILWDEGSGDEISLYESDIMVQYSNVRGGYAGEGNINADPLFANPAENNFELLDGSPCIDAGNPDAVYDDVSNSDNPANAAYPSAGGVRNDMGAYGGPEAMLLFDSVEPALPSAPTGVEATAGDGNVTISWQAASGAASYNIYLAEESGVTADNYEDLAGGAMAPGVESPYVVDNLSNGVTHYFVVTAVTSAGEGPHSAEVDAMPQSSAVTPAAPTNVKATAGDGQVTLSWDPVEGVSYYRIYIGNAPGVDNEVNNISMTGGDYAPDFEHAVTGLTNGQTYYFVVAVVADGGAGEEGPLSVEVNATPKEMTVLETITDNSNLGMTFVQIPAGTFMMGSPKDELGADDDEWPRHEVTLRQDFYIMTTEVTQSQWTEVMGSNPADFAECGGTCPVETVSWNDIQDFIAALNAMDGRTYRLPTEAEWEYAARAGTTTAFYNGDITEEECGIDPNLDAIGWYCGNSDYTTHPTAQKQPNAWGLYDMSGNVWEWVEDDWHYSYDEAPTDGGAWTDSPRGTSRVLRGGGWGYDAQHCRAAHRNQGGPTIGGVSVGFRLALSLGR
jgi:formylglycine-generating enzyme required for sulfatase activity